MDLDSDDDVPLASLQVSHTEIADNEDFFRNVTLSVVANQFTQFVTVAT